MMTFWHVYGNFNKLFFIRQPYSLDLVIKHISYIYILNPEIWQSHFYILEGVAKTIVFEQVPKNLLRSQISLAKLFGMVLAALDINYKAP